MKIFSFYPTLFLAIFIFALPQFLTAQFTVNITSDNPNPTIGCQMDEEINYYVAVTNTPTSPGTYNLEISSINAIQTVTEVIGYTSNVGSTFTTISILNIPFSGLAGTETYTFKAKAINLPANNTLSCSATLTTGPQIITASHNLIITTPITVTNANLSSLIGNQLPTNACDGVLRKVNVNGVFSIDTDYCFSNVKFIMGPQAEIRVMHNKNFQLLRSKLFVCQYGSCVGITVLNNASLVLELSKIMGAWIGVSAFDAREIKIKNNVFDQNHIGVSLGASSQLPFTIIHPIEGNRFLSSEPLLTGGMRTYLGIEAIDLKTELVVSSSPPSIENYNACIFDGVFNGIRTKNTSLRVSNCNFYNIRRQVSSLGAPNNDTGYGILAKSNGSKVLKVESNQFLGDDFQNITSAIVTHNMHTDVRRLKMTNVDNGILIFDNKATVFLDRNEIEANIIGIGTVACSPLKGTISENIIKMGIPQVGIGKFVGIGIRHDGDFKYSGAKVTWNEFKNEIELYGCPTGIHLGNSSDIYSHHNFITFVEENYFRNGMVLSGGNHSNRIEFNTVINNSGGEQFEKTGIYTGNSSNTILKCNKIFDTEKGFQFSFSCIGTDFRGNSLWGDQKVGLELSLPSFLSQSTIISPQIHRGNVWLGSFGLGARNLAESFDILQQSRFKVDVNAVAFGGSAAGLPPSIESPAGMWFIQENDNNQTVGCVESFTSDGTPSSLDSIIAEAELGFGLTKDNFDWATKRQLTQRVFEMPEWISQPIFINFIEDAANTDVLDYHHAIQGWHYINHINEADAAQIQLLQDSYNYYSDEKSIEQEKLAKLEEDQVKSNNPTGFQPVIDVLKEEISNLNQKLFESSTQQFELYENFRKKRKDQAIELQGFVLGLNDDKIFKQNEKTVLNILIDNVILGKDSFDLNQINQLYSIANQCYFLGGDGVMMARGLINGCIQPTHFDDEKICKIAIEQIDEIETRSNSIEKHLTIYPNPSNQSSSIQSSIPIIAFKMYDLHGQIVMEGNSFEQMKIELPTAKLSVGTYFIETTDKQGYNTTSKLVVRH